MSRWPCRGLVLGLLLGCLAGPGAAAAESTPRRGGTLRLAFPSDWRSLDPSVAFDISAVPLQRLLFQTLLDFDTNNQVFPSAARSWSISADQKTYTFHLRPGLRFAHGREVEAADFVFALERVIDPKTGSTGQTYFRGVAGYRDYQQGREPRVRGLRAPARDILEIELDQPDFTFRFVLALCFASAVPRELVAGREKEFLEHPVGSGPYRITTWRRHIRYRFERNPHFNSTNTAFVNAIEIMIGGDRALHAMMFERGDLDLLHDPTPPDQVRFRRDPRRRSWLISVPMASTDYLFLNTEMKPFDDVRVRRAVSHAIDKRRLVKLANPDFAVAHGVLPPTMPGFDPTLQSAAYDPARARELLREAGHPDGFTTKLWHSLSLPYVGRVATAIQQDLRLVGINVELQPTPTAAFEVGVRLRRRVPCGYWGWVQDYPDPSNFLDVLLNGERITDSDCNNCAFYNNPEANRLLAAAAVLDDAARRIALFQQAERLILADAPWVPIMFTTFPMLRQPWVRGFRPHPVWLYRYEEVWLDK